MTTNPKRCMARPPSGCGKWAATGSLYCTKHAALGRQEVTTAKIDASKIRVSDIEVGHLALLMIDLKTGKQWTEHKYSDEWLAKYGRTHG